MSKITFPHLAEYTGCRITHPDHDFHQILRPGIWLEVREREHSWVTLKDLGGNFHLCIRAGLPSSEIWKTGPDRGGGTPSRPPQVPPLIDAWRGRNDSGNHQLVRQDRRLRPTPLCPLFDVGQISLIVTWSSVGPGLVPLPGSLFRCHRKLQHDAPVGPPRNYLRYHFPLRARVTLGGA